MCSNENAKAYKRPYLNLSEVSGERELLHVQRNRQSLKIAQIQRTSGLTVRQINQIIRIYREWQYTW